MNPLASSLETEQPPVRASVKPERSSNVSLRAIFSGVLGISILLAFVYGGGLARDSLRLTLPGPVAGLLLLAGVALLIQRLHGSLSRRFMNQMVPVSRLLILHMGLLFVPAGVGIITEFEAIRHNWLPIIAALLGSTLVGLMATAWLMDRFAGKH